jgi:CHAT domain-containing protein
MKAKGVVGLARGFLAAGAAAAVVSLWSVHDASTAALMDKMSQYLGNIKD